MEVVHLHTTRLTCDKKKKKLLKTNLAKNEGSGNPCSLNAESDHGQHFLLTGISIGNKIKRNKYTRHPHIWKLARPTNKDRKVHWSNMG